MADVVRACMSVATNSVTVRWSADITKLAKPVEAGCTGLCESSSRVKSDEMVTPRMRTLSLVVTVSHLSCKAGAHPAPKWDIVFGASSEQPTLNSIHLQTICCHPVASVISAVSMTCSSGCHVSWCHVSWRWQCTCSWESSVDGRSLQCAGQSLQDLPCREQIVVDQGLNLVAPSTKHEPQLETWKDLSVKTDQNQARMKPVLQLLNRVMSD